jgi:hypothetical protein
LWPGSMGGYCFSMTSSPEGLALRSAGVEKPQSPASMEMKMRIFVQVGSCIA